MRNLTQLKYNEELGFKPNTSLQRLTNNCTIVCQLKERITQVVTSGIRIIDGQKFNLEKRLIPVG